MLGERWSFGGTASTVASDAGAFFPWVVLADGQNAVADGWWRPPSGRPPGLIVPALADLTAADDRGVTYALRAGEMSGNSDAPDREAWPQTLRVRLDPVPAPGTRWIEIRDSDGTAARLLASPRRAARVGLPVPVAGSPAERELLRHTQALLSWSQSALDAEVLGPLVRRSRSQILGQAARLRDSGELDPASGLPDEIAALCDALTGQHTAPGLPAGWAAMMAGAERRDGPAWSLDLTAAALPAGEVTVRLDTVVSASDSCRLYLRAAPGWHQYGEPDEDGGRSVREAFQVSAADDRGGAYISHLGGNSQHIRRHSREHRGHEEHFLRFQPRLDPLATALHLTFRGTAEEILVSLDLS